MDKWNADATGKFVENSTIVKPTSKRKRLSSKQNKDVLRFLAKHYSRKTWE